MKVSAGLNISFNECLQSMLPLAHQEIHLWLAYYDEITDEQMHRAYRLLLNDDEKAQELRFHFSRDRLRYLVTRALVRTVLSRYEPVGPKHWVFSTNASGRPEIANAMSVANLTFNISHTHSLIVMGVTRARELGVDAENVLDRQLSIGFADRYLSPTEGIALANAPINQRRDRFFEYWTLKESYIKARGLGLSIPMDKFSFQYPHERGIEITIDPELTDDSERWQFWQFRPTSKYLVAVCAGRADTHSPGIVVKKVVPMSVEKILATTFTRTSG